MRASVRFTVLFALGAMAFACATSVSDPDTNDRMLATNNPAPLTACVATDCPAPWATCPGGPGLCGTDTTRDVFNCGACGNACPHADHSLNASAVCSGGACKLACDPMFADCNQDPSDGCEVSVGDDPKNCGGCGLACKDGELCWRGACGCPKGFTQCGKSCKNLQTDSMACGACDNACGPPKTPTDPAWICGPNVQPSDTSWGCSGGACKITCTPSWGDCNNDLCTDGCETDLDHSAANCGACGRACEAGQECVHGECLCPPGTTRCGDSCVDTLIDPNNCGSCGNMCPGASDSTAHGGPTCKGGTCGYVCYPGYADCNHRINDGCEANLQSDQKNCGACGTKCDTARGQPCVVGQCLTKPCDGPEATR